MCAERTECSCVRLSKSFTAWAPDPQTRKASQSTFGPCAEKIPANPLLELQAHFWDSPGKLKERRENMARWITWAAEFGSKVIQVDIIVVGRVRVNSESVKSRRVWVWIQSFYRNFSSQTDKFRRINGLHVQTVCVQPLRPPTTLLVWQRCCDVITCRKFLIKLVGEGDKAERAVVKLIDGRWKHWWQRWYPCQKNCFVTAAWCTKSLIHTHLNDTLF